MKNMRFLIIGNMMSEIDFENLSQVLDHQIKEM